MSIERFEDMNAVALDVFREIGSIGEFNAATQIKEILEVSLLIKIASETMVAYE